MQTRFIYNDLNSKRLSYLSTQQGDSIVILKTSLVSTAAVFSLIVVYFLLVSRASFDSSVNIIPTNVDAIFSCIVLVSSLLLHYCVYHYFIKYELNSRPIVIVPSNNDQSNDIQLEDLSSSHLIRQRRRNRFKRFRYSFKRNRLERKWLLGEADYTDIKAGTQNSKDTKVIRLPILASIFEAWPESLDVMMDGECNVKQAWREAIEDAEIELTLSDVGGISIGLEYDVCDLQVLDVSEFMLFL